MPGVFVTVHRVGPDSAAPLDSTLTDSRGGYTIRYSRFGSEDAVYFAAAVYRGIAYFTSPLRGEITRGDEAEITVFDTTTRPVNFVVQGHHVVVSAPKPDGVRDVVEVFELSNDTSVTVVARDTLTPVWSAPLPPDAANWVAGQGDVAAPAMAARKGRVLLLAPFGPGIKQLSYSYTLPPGSFPLRLILEHPTSVLEVLAEEPGAQVRSVSLRSVDSASTEGRTFKRFLGQNVPAGEEIRIDVPTSSAGTRQRVLTGVALLIGLAMLGALVRSLRARRPIQRAPELTVGLGQAETLAAAIAALDARHEAGDTTLDAARYQSERATLKAQLTALLAGDAPSA